MSYVFCQDFFSTVGNFCYQQFFILMKRGLQMNEIKINNNNGLLTVSSLQVAHDFKKLHKDVLEKIGNIIAEIRLAENSADVTFQLLVAFVIISFLF